MSGERWGARMGAMPSRLAIRRALAATALGGALAAVSLPASAHAELLSSDPADGSTVTELTSVHLEFSEELLDIGNSITVTDGAGATQDLTVTLAEPTVLEAPVGALVPGDITISWRNASVDGHTEEGELQVTLEAPATSASPDPSSSAVLTAVADPPSTASPNEIAPVGDSSASPWLWALLGLIVIGGTAAAIIAATRRPPTES